MSERRAEIFAFAFFLLSNPDTIYHIEILHHYFYKGGYNV